MTIIEKYNEAVDRVNRILHYIVSSKLVGGTYVGLTVQPDPISGGYNGEAVALLMRADPFWVRFNDGYILFEYTIEDLPNWKGVR